MKIIRHSYFSPTAIAGMTSPQNRENHDRTPFVIQVFCFLFRLATAF